MLYVFVFSEMASLRGLRLGRSRKDDHDCNQHAQESGMYVLFIISWQLQLNTVVIWRCGLSASQWVDIESIKDRLDRFSLLPVEVVAVVVIL